MLFANILISLTYQHNFVRNSNGSLLDLVFSSFPNVRTFPAPDILLSADSHHLAILFHVPHAVITFSRPRCVNRRHFSSANYPEIINYLNLIDWDNLLSPLSIHVAVNTLYSHLNHVISSFVPCSSSITRVGQNVI